MLLVSLYPEISPGSDPRMRTSYFIFAVILTAQAFNLDFLPLKSKSLIFENKFTENALDKALASLMKESSKMYDRSRILKALKKNVEEQILKKFEKIPAATRPRVKTVGRNKSLRRKNKVTWYNRIS